MFRLKVVLKFVLVVCALACSASVYATTHIKLSSATYSVSETAGYAVITATRIGGGITETDTVDFVTSDGTAIAGTDYVAVNTQMVFTASARTQTMNVPIIYNPLPTGNRTVNITISNPQGGADLQSPSSAVLTIIDSGTPLVNVAVGNVTASEGDSGTTSFDFPVSLSTASVVTVTVAYATSDGTADSSDYTPVSGVLTFLPGETNKVVSVLVNGDTTYENDESFFLNLSSPTNGVITDGQGTGTILNDDAVPNISIADVSQSEGNTGVNAMNFTVSLDRASQVPITVDYATADGTATVAGNDYLATSGTLIFNAGETNKTIAVSVLGDDLNELDETFYVNLTNATVGVIANAQAIGTILNDDAAPTISIDDSSVIEGDSGTAGMVFTVSLSQPSGLSVSVDWATADGTATVVDGDYTANSGTIVFAPGEDTKTVTVYVNGDTRNEADETFMVNLSNSTNAPIARAQGIGTIINDDPLPSLSINNVTVLEGDTGTTNAVFTVALSAMSGQTVTVDYGTADGTALGGSDFVPVSGTLTFAPGETNKTITVAVNGDYEYEADETYTVNLTDPVYATIANGTGTGTILNDDPTVSIPSIYVAKLSARINRATVGNDYLSLSGRLNPSGCASVLAGASVTVRINGVQIAAPVTLNGLGYAGRISLSSSTGAYRISFGGLDLAGVLGLQNITESGLVNVTVEVTVSDAGLDVATVHGQLEMPYTTTQDSATKMKFSFKKHRTLTGTFNWNKTKAVQLKDGTFSMAAKGVIEGLDGALIVPTGPVQITLGGATLNVPTANASLVIVGRTFKLKATGVAGTGIPAAGSGADTSYKLPAWFEIPTAAGTQTFETVIELKRSAGSSVNWQR